MFLCCLWNIGQKQALLIIGLELDEEGLVGVKDIASKELDCTAVCLAGVGFRLGLVLGTYALIFK